MGTPTRYEGFFPPKKLDLDFTFIDIVFFWIVLMITLNIGVILAGTH
jgi:hypothetical protein